MRRARQKWGCGAEIRMMAARITSNTSKPMAERSIAKDETLER
jgi:hypothetical protein